MQINPFIIATGLYTQYSYEIRINILNHFTNRIVYMEKILPSSNKIDGGYFTFKTNSLFPGIYTYCITFIRSRTNDE
jgi:hypothetical protein